MAAGEALSTQTIQCPDWRQYVTEIADTELRVCRPKRSFEVVCNNGKSVQVNGRLDRARTFNFDANERTDLCPQAQGFWTMANLVARPATVGATRTPDTKAPIVSRCFYAVLKGDTLGKIAARILGSESRWKEIARANKVLRPLP